MLVLGKYFFKGLKFFMINLIFYHDVLLIICYFVLFFIISFMGSVYMFSGIYLKNLSKMFLEITWTVVPAMMLLVLVEPSLVLLYLSEAFTFNNGQVIKVVGHQWYWSYSSDFMNSLSKSMVEYDSYMSSSEMGTGDFRLLEVDLPCVMLAEDPIFFFMNSSDVIHSFALPSIGMKIDAFPGRLNVGVSSGVSVGCYWGQCSEICGANHAFMPMGLEAILFFSNMS